MGRDFFPQKPDKFRVLIPLFVGDIFNIHIYAIQLVLFNVICNLPRQPLRIPQGKLACSAIPMIAQHGHHFNVHTVHSTD